MAAYTGCPELWSPEEVRTWISRCNLHYSLNLTPAHIAQFSINGKALLTLTREDFCHRLPGAGDVICNVLRHLADSAQAGPLAFLPRPPGMDNTLEPPPVHIPWECDRARYQGSAAESPPRPCPSLVHYHLLHARAFTQDSSRDTAQPPSTLTRLLSDVTGNRATPAVHRSECHNARASSGQDLRPIPLASPALYSPVVNWSSPSGLDPEDVSGELSPSVTMETETGRYTVQGGINGRESGIGEKTLNTYRPSSLYAADACLPPKKRRMKESLTSELELSRDVVTCSTEIPHTPDNEAKSDAESNKIDSQNANNKLLWEYISELLQTPRREHPVRWLDKPSLTFRITDPSGLAELWGQQKQKENMTYEKLSRALRYYYPMNIICKVHGKKLTYRFTTPPTKIKKGIRGAKPGVPHKRRKVDPNKPSQGKAPKKLPKTPTSAVVPEEIGVLDLSTKSTKSSPEKQFHLDVHPTKIPPCLPSSTSSSDSGIEIDIPISETPHAAADRSPLFNDDPFSFEASDTVDASPSSSHDDVGCLDLRRPSCRRDIADASQSPTLVPARSPTLNNLNRLDSYSRTMSKESQSEMGNFLRSERSAFSIVSRAMLTQTDFQKRAKPFQRDSFDSREDFTIFAL